MTDDLSKIPSGVRYHVGAQAELRRAVENCAMSVFAGWSYEEVITPSVDYYSLFEHGMGAEAERAFRFADADGRLLALRPDVTSSVARAAATLLSERSRPLRLCYAAPVFHRHPQTKAAWRRESTQLGCELFGASGSLADMEVLAIAAETLKRLKLDDGCCITLNNVEIFNGIAERLELDDAARERMRTLIDVRDTAELRRFLSQCQTTSEEQDVFSRLTQLSGKGEVITQARRVITNPRSVKALDALDEIWKIIDSLGLSSVFEIDLGDVSELSYYTGLVFKIYTRGAGARVGRGGRYDHLTANFGRPEHAIGFVLELDSLTDVIAKSGASNLPETSGAHSAVQNENAIASFQEARTRRANDERVRLKL
jgi:ATP phosphoribosyltransferase regulatory subunit